MNKGNIISYIGDGRTSLLKIKDYYVFEDNWITEFNKTLYDNNGNEYNVLDYQEIDEYISDVKESPLTNEIKHPINSWHWIKRSCLKLDRKANVGDILYVKHEIL